jgi:hypothetical protein
MRSKAIGFLALAVVFGITASAQTTRDQIEKTLKDPKRKENEAKADRRLHERNRVISDTTTSGPGIPKKKTGKRKKTK